MAGAADSAFRSVAMGLGAAFCVSEMVSAKALLMGDVKTRQLMEHTENEKPFGIQLFGSSPSDLGRAARIAVNSYKPDFIDINMGCPAPKITSSGAGAALMRTPDTASDIVKAVKDSAAVPVTVKIRSGFSEAEKNAATFSRLLEEAGADAITVHGRTREQLYRPPVDLSSIKQSVDAVSIPVTGNGDIWNYADLLLMREKTGCAGVMIGRAALGNPFIFAEIAAAVRNEPYEPPALTARLDVLRRQIEMAVRNKGEHIALLEARKHAAWYIKGIRGAAALRAKAYSMDNLRDLDSFIALAGSLSE